MKTLLYYLLFLVFIAVVSGFLLSGDTEALGTTAMLGVAAALILYTIGMSFVGEGVVQSELEAQHKNFANRAGLTAGMIIFSLGAIYQLFISHSLDWWLLVGLIAINLTKIVSLIYLNYKK